MVRLALFLGASAGVTALSWSSLHDPRCHGFYRFFAFQSLAALLLLNVPLWFRNPFSLRQLGSWLLGAVSIVLAVEGFRLLRVAGRPSKDAAAGGADLGFERTTRLVETGAYRYIRHPLYASLAALTGCAYLKDPWSAASLALGLGAAGFLIATAAAEERENLARFGAAYAAYMRRTRRFVPFLY